MASPPVDWYQIILLDDRHTCVNNLLKVVTWKRNGQDLNPRPFESQVQYFYRYAVPVPVLNDDRLTAFDPGQPG